MVCGTRTITDKQFVYECLDSVCRDLKIDAIVSGKARGVDSLAEQYADENGLGFIGKEPDYYKHGFYAPLHRNIEMAILCEKGIAIWDGLSTGTAHSISQLKKRGKLLKIFFYE